MIYITLITVKAVWIECRKNIPPIKPKQKPPLEDSNYAFDADKLGFTSILYTNPFYTGDVLELVDLRTCAASSNSSDNQ